MLTDLASVCPMIAIFLHSSGFSPVPLLAEPAVELGAIHRFLDTVNRSLDFITPFCRHQQSELGIPAA
jgi:hypothetical protein